MGELAVGVGEPAAREGDRRASASSRWRASVIVSAISAGRRRVVCRCAGSRGARRASSCRQGETFDPDLDENGLLEQVQLDLGQVISAAPRLVYPNDAWADELQQPAARLLRRREMLVEYTAPPGGLFPPRRTAPQPVIPVAAVEDGRSTARIQPVSRRPSRRSRVRVVEKRQRPAGAGQAARPRRGGRVPGAGGPPPHPQPGLVRGLQRRLRPPDGTLPLHVHLHPRRDARRPAAGQGLRRGLQGLRDPAGAQGRRGRRRTPTRSSSRSRRCCPGARRAG